MLWGDRRILLVFLLLEVLVLTISLSGNKTRRSSCLPGAVVRGPEDIPALVYIRGGIRLTAETEAQQPRAQDAPPARMRPQAPGTAGPRAGGARRVQPGITCQEVLHGAGP